MKKLYFIMMILAAMSLTACDFRLWPENEEPDYYSEEWIDETETKEISYLEDVEPYVAVDGGFSIKFPGIPTYSVDKVETDYGTIDMHFYIYEGSMYKAYMVAYADYPPQVVIDKGVELVLKDAAYGMTEGMEVHFMEEFEKDLASGLVISASDDVSYMDVDLYLIGDRLYQVAVIDTYQFAEDGLEFLASFDFL